jgi:hypothetical protein
MSQMIADFYAKISVDSSGLQKGLVDAKTGLAGVKKEAQGAGGVVGDLSKKFMGMVNPTTLVLGGLTAVTGFLVSATRETINYAGQVRQLSQISGESMENTSRFIQVLDDYSIGADEALVATRALTSQGHTPSIATLAKLSDQYLALNNAEDKNAFVLKNLGRGGLAWIEVLNKGSKALLEQGAAVNKSQIYTEKMWEEVTKNKIAVDNWNDSVQGLKISLGNDLLPPLTAVTNAANDSARAHEILNEQGKNWFFTSTKNKEAAYAQAQAEREAATALMLNSQETEKNTESMKEQEMAAKGMSERNEELVSALGTAASAWTIYRDGVAEAKKELAEGTITTDEYKAKIGELSGAFEETKNSFILSAVEMRLAADGVFDDADLDKYLKVAKGLGLITSAQADAAKAWIKSADDITGAARDEGTAFQHVQGRADDALGSMENFYFEQAELASGIKKEALPTTAALARAMGSLPPDGTEWNYNFNITKTGSVPKMPTGGGGGSVYDPRRYEQEFAEGGQLPLGKGWAQVGEEGFEFISPTGFVFTNQESKKLKAAGLLPEFAKRVGGDLFGTGVFSGGGSGGTSQTTTTKRRRASGDRLGSVSAGMDAGSVIPLSTQVDAIAEAVAADVSGASIAAGAPAISQEAVLSAQANQTQLGINAQVQSSEAVVNELKELQRLIKKQPTKNDTFTAGRYVQQTSI